MCYEIIQTPSYNQIGITCSIKNSCMSPVSQILIKNHSSFLRNLFRIWEGNGDISTSETSFKLISLRHSKMMIRCKAKFFVELLFCDKFCDQCLAFGLKPFVALKNSISKRVFENTRAAVRYDVVTVRISKSELSISARILLRSSS